MERNTIKHVEEKHLEAYAMNRVPHDELAEIEEHLLFCTICLEKLEAVERYVKAMQGAAKRIAQEEIQAPATPGTWDRVRAWLRTPAPLWVGVVAMACVVLMVGPKVRERPGTPIEVGLQAIRGTPTGNALSGHPLNLHLDGRGVTEKPVWQIEIVDAEGSQVWAGTGVGSGTMIEAKVEKSLSPGTYFVRLLKEGTDPAREYELVVRKDEH
jgi:hypothetical protein